MRTGLLGSAQLSKTATRVDEVGLAKMLYLVHDEVGSAMRMISITVRVDDGVASLLEMESHLSKPRRDGSLSQLLKLAACCKLRRDGVDEPVATKSAISIRVGDVRWS